MNTYRYCVEEIADDVCRVTEEDGPSARATGEYATLAEAQSAVESIVNHPLDWEAGIYNADGEEEIRYWVSEFAIL